MKLPSLTCPLCGGTHVHKNRAGSIECDDCNNKITKKGKIEKKDSSNPTSHSRKKNYPEGFFS